MGLSIPVVQVLSPSRWKSAVESVRGFFAFHGVWALGVRALRKLSVRDKILVIVALVALPMLPMATYLAVQQTSTVEKAETRIAGAQMVAETHRLTDVVRQHLHQLDTARQVDAVQLHDAVQHLLAARELGQRSGLRIDVTWERIEPALTRLNSGTALTPAGRIEALVAADSALARWRVDLQQQAGLLLSDDKQEYALATLTFIRLPRALDELSVLSRSLRSYVAVQDQAAAELPRIQPQLMALLGQLSSVESVMQTIEQMLKSGDLPEGAMPELGAFKDVTALLSQVHRAIQDDAYLNAQELVAIRSGEEAAVRQLAALRDRYLHELESNYRSDAKSAHLKRLLVVSSVVLSLSVAAYLFYAFYLVMRGGLNSVVESLKRMASGDLRSRRLPLGGDEVAATLLAMGQSVEQLSELLVHVRQGSNSVSQAAQQIAAGNADLRSRNHRTSDALERVVEGVSRYSAQLEACAAQVETVVGTVEKLRLQSTRNRRQMDLLRETLSTVRSNSQQIAAAVSLIDNVAFRTNILALNASIEASKAGEAGKGFAVVAQEVRGLAQRSADAARRIHGIVAASAAQVEQSAHLADDTGHSIAESDGHIDKIHNAMGDVAGLTREGQRESAVILDQVRDLRETTEKNLGLVDQLASASFSLRSHGERLTHRLSHFKLS